MKQTVAIIGGGPAALMLAATLDETRFDIHIYEKNTAPARKFLVAGAGGFNLTHSEPVADFITRYSPASFFSPLLKAFSNEELRAWLLSIGIPTYVGSSGRVFPEKGIKPIQVLNAFLDLLKKKGVFFSFSHEWIGWGISQELLFKNGTDTLPINADINVFALGGSSWKVTGSDGSWAGLFQKQDICLVPFQPSNCAFGIRWSDELLKSAEGKPLKNISIHCGDRHKKGEVTLTRFGLEGSGIYALSPCIREQLSQSAEANIFIDLKPELSLEEISLRLKNRRANRSLTKHLQEILNLDDTKIALLKSEVSKEAFLDASLLAGKIKQLPLNIYALAPIDEAISTSGGISLKEIDASFLLKKIPHTYVIGEMLDWDAPTGGYLLQACFSMGHFLATCLNNLS